MVRVRRCTWTGCLIAVVGTGAMGAFRAAIGDVAGYDFPLLPFILSVMLSAYYGGLLPGLLATALGATIGVFVFFPPAWSFAVHDPADWLRLVIFLAEGTVISTLCGALLTARRRADVFALDAQDKQRQLEAKDRSKNEFLATLAHELRNPMGTIRTTLAAAQAERGSFAGRRWSDEIINRQVSQVCRLVDDLSELSRIGRGKLRLRKERIDLRDVVDRAVESTRHMIDGRGHHLEIVRPASAAPVNGDAARLTQVVSNLLANSAKYTPEKGHIRIAVETGKEIVIRVTDDGLGIPAENLPHIFDLGEQVEGHFDRSEGGLGIGLSVVRRLVEAHGGTVNAVSDGPGRGCEFVVRLPLPLPEQRSVRPEKVVVGRPPQSCRG